MSDRMTDGDLRAMLDRPEIIYTFAGRVSAMRAMALEVLTLRALVRQAAQEGYRAGLWADNLPPSALARANAIADRLLRGEHGGSDV
jgi:hypothetical protein